ncbi:MAG: tRNA preQ1(34) S-adenosylmethionine ribosyltransferase-isomerase QueA [Burkholderiales bacterium]
MRTDDFDYLLPPELIAQFPLAQRGASRLLHLDGNSGELHHRQFRDLLHLVNAGDVMVFNDTRVIKARLVGEKSSGGKIEVMVERVINEHEVLALVRASKSPQPGGMLRLAGAFDAKVIGRIDDLFHLRFDSSETVFALLENYGALPLPPYITHTPDTTDDERYQTVFARESGAVAAPTAGLHFDDAMLEALKQKSVEIAYVTLHVGAGTFQPVRVDDVAEHKMHSEWYEIPQITIDKIIKCNQIDREVIAVGTTSLRALEGSALKHDKLTAGVGETTIFITPGFAFKVVDRLLTNFHLPKSTLLMLVSAFGGMENIHRAYQEAIAQRYRFFSYGDAMLIERHK